MEEGAVVADWEISTIIGGILEKSHNKERKPRRVPQLASLLPYYIFSSPIFCSFLSSASSSSSSSSSASFVLVYFAVSPSGSLCIPFIVDKFMKTKNSFW
jgi:hypothetical protein